MRRRSLLFNTAVYVAGQFGAKALAFLLLVVYTRFLVPADFGITGTLGAYGTVLATMCVLGLTGSVSRHYFDLKDQPDELRSYLSSVFAFQMAVATILVLALELCGPWLWSRFTSGQIGFSYVRLMLWSTLFASAIAIPQAVFQAEERATVLVGAQLVQQVLWVAIGAIFVGALDQHALGALRVQVIASAMLGGTLAVVFARRHGSRVLRWSHVWRALRFGLPLVPHLLGTILIQTFDRMMLEKHTPQADVGLYSIASLLASTLAMIAGSVNQAWSPHFFRTTSDEEPAARQKADVFAALFVALFSILGLVGALLAPELLRVLGPHYVAVQPYLIPFVIGSLIATYYILPANQLLLGSQTRWFSIATGGGTILAIVLDIWLIPRYGGMAAAWVFVVATACQSAIVFAAAIARHESLVGRRHAVVMVMTLGLLALATTPLALGVRVALLAGATATIYVLLIRGKLRWLSPRHVP